MKKLLRSGFTLIELLLVIVILGILITIALNVINPARIQRRAREAVAMSQVSKMCTAIRACASTSYNYTSCFTDPVGASTQPAAIYVDARLTAVAPTTTNVAGTAASAAADTQPPWTYYTYQRNNDPTWGGPFSPYTLRITAALCGTDINGSCTATSNPAMSAGAKGGPICYIVCDYNFETGESRLVKGGGCY